MARAEATVEDRVSLARYLSGRLLFLNTLLQEAPLVKQPR